MTHLESRRQQGRTDAKARLERMEVGETLQISAYEVDKYRWARDQLPDREYSGVKDGDADRTWWILTRRK